jgi:hypothetical protein
MGSKIFNLLRIRKLYFIEIGRRGCYIVGWLADGIRAVVGRPADVASQIVGGTTTDGISGPGLGLQVWRNDSMYYRAATAICALAMFCPPTKATSETPCHIEEADTAKIALALLKEKSNQVILDNDKYLAIHEVKTGAVWTLTKAGHPAHPAVVCRYPVRAPDGNWHARIEAKCGGPKPECDALIESFKQMN